MRRRRKWVKNWDAQASWYAAHENWTATAEPRLEKEKRRVMWVWCDEWCSWAEWAKRNNIWTCVETEPESAIKWMVGKQDAVAHLTLLKMGVKWEWLPEKKQVPV
jgi:hypothetical protein